MKNILVPVRYPITRRGEKTLRKALEVCSNEETVLIIYHINLLYGEEKVSRGVLKRDVEKMVPEFKDLKDVTYSIEESYLLDESILKKISRSNINEVIMGASMIPRWLKFLKFWSAYKITDEIKKAADCKVIVVE